MTNLHISLCGCSCALPNCQRYRLGALRILGTHLAVEVRQKALNDITTDDVHCQGRISRNARCVSLVALASYRPAATFIIEGTI